MGIIELLTPAYEAAWLPWAVQYFFLIGIAATTALTASVLAFGKPGSCMARLLPAAVVVLLTACIAAPVSLLADLHQPGRFWHFYANPTPWSWMSLGAYLLPVFVVLSLLFSLLWWQGKQGLLRLLALLLALSAVSILVYTGGEMAVIKARPLWHTLLLPVNLALTGWLGSLGAMLLVARWLPANWRDSFPAGLVRRMAQLCTLVLLAAAVTWAALGATGQEPSFDAALQLFNEFGAWRLALLGSILGGVLLLAMVWRPLGQKSLTAGDQLLLAVLMLAASWVFRWMVFMAVQTVPKFGAGLYLQGISWGSDGVLGMVGVFGLVAALLAMVTYALERYPGKPLASA